MLSGFRIQLAVAAALLLAQLGLPMVHGFASAGADPGVGAMSVLASGPDLRSQPDVDRHGGSTHDPSLCPICLALRQVRNGLGRVPGVAPLQTDSLLTGLPWSPRIALPSGVELDSAPTRAPPLRSLSLA